MTVWVTVLATVLAASPDGTGPALRVDAARVLHRVSPLLYGACIEDVNHEIYGGLYSQMVFGESFQEPPRTPPLKGFTAHGGLWRTRDGEVGVDGGDGPKLVADLPPLAVGEVSVDVRFPAHQAGNAGLILRVDRPGKGADAFTGYEVSLESSGKLVLGRHRRNWELLREVACDVPVNAWVPLAVRLGERSLAVTVGGRTLLTFEDKEHPLGPGGVGLRVWQRPARFRDLRVTTGGVTHALSFEPTERDEFGAGVSGMWRALRRGTASGEFALETAEPFAGNQAQRLTFRAGEGEIGVENRGLNRWGLNLVAGKPFEGYVWVRAEGPAALAVALETADGGRVLAESVVEVAAGGWARHDFTLTPDAADPAGRFAIKLKRPGSVVLGHAFLQPGAWGRFKGLPDRKDVAEALIAEGVSVLRYGGSMVNHPGYRWKNMVGPRDRRPTGPGWWYPHSSNGWGIFDFLNFCEAAGIPGIPAVNMGETPQDMADFVEYANGPAESPWGRKRAADGHPEPYRLKHLELGNEEAVNEAYWQKFAPLAEAIWARDPGIILVVGDFAYGKVITDPFRFEGGAVVDSLAAHRKILELARTRGREVWFDIHVTTDHPPEPNGLRPERSYIDQLGKLAPGANYKVAVFEYNSGNHAMKRALSNALATNEVERVGDLLPIACAANCLQPDGQNDNGWDQGLLFLNPTKVWLQPPGYLIQMARRHFQPLLVHSELQGDAAPLSVNAKRSDDGKTLVLQVVNPGAAPKAVALRLEGFAPGRPTAQVEELSGPPDAVNTASEPDRVAPRRSEWRHDIGRSPASYTFPPHSLTMIRLE